MTLDGTRKHADLVLRRGTVIAMDPKRRILENASVAVEGTRIAAVGPAEEIEAAYRAEREIDCLHKAILPGLIDAHGHAGHALLKTIGADTRSHWMHIATPTYHHYTTDEFWYVEARLAALERLKMGVTCGLSVISSAQRSDAPIFGSNNARGYADVGVRGVVAVGPCNPPFPRKFSRWRGGVRHEVEVPFEGMMEGAEAVIEAWNGGADGRIRVFIAPFVLLTSIFGSGPSAADVAVALSDHDRLMMRRVREVAAKHGVRIHTEAFGGMIRLARRCEDALLGPDVHIQHCTGISFEEAMILAETGTHVTSAPGYGQINGRCPIPELIGLGANVAITTDGNSPSTPFDLLQAARQTQLIQRMLCRDPFLIPNGKVLEMITIDAAKALGWDDEIGSLEPGKQADIAVINLWQPHLVPNVMPVHRVICESVGHDVETVVVAGRVLMEGRRVLSVDEDEVLSEGEAEARRLIERAGLERHMALPSTFWGHAQGWLDEQRVDYDSLPSRP